MLSIYYIRASTSKKVFICMYGKILKFFSSMKKKIFRLDVDDVPDCIPSSNILSMRKYKIVDFNIGNGRHGCVFLVKEINSNKLYACKKFVQRLRHTREYFVKRLHGEYCISNHLVHKNIVNVIELVEYNNDWFSILEYCSNGNLYDICNKQRLTMNQIERYFKQLMTGLSYIHSKGIAHKDIKLENLLIDEEDNLKISDFGVSELFKMELALEKSLCSGFQGSPPYLAPEIYSKNPYDGEKADIWSCGIVLYIFLFNHMPFLKASTSCYAYKYFLMNRFNDNSMIARLPLNIKNLALGMLDPDPKTRYSLQDIYDNIWFISILAKSED